CGPSAVQCSKVFANTTLAMSIVVPSSRFTVVTFRTLRTSGLYGNSKVEFRFATFHSFAGSLSWHLLSSKSFVSCSELCSLNRCTGIQHGCQLNVSISRASSSTTLVLRPTIRRVGQTRSSGCSSDTFWFHCGVIPHLLNVNARVCLPVSYQHLIFVEHKNTQLREST